MDTPDPLYGTLTPHRPHPLRILTSRRPSTNLEHAVCSNSIPPAKPGALAVSRSKRPVETWPLRGHLGHPTGGYFIPTGRNSPAPSRCRHPGSSDQDRRSLTAQPPRFLPPPGGGFKTGVPRGSKNWTQPPFTMGIVTLRSTVMGVSLVMLEPPTWGSSPLYSRNCQTLGAAPAKPAGLPRLR